MTEKESVIPPITEKFRSILIFGPPGAGKGTVSKTLSQAGSMCHVSSGDIFRGLSPDSPAGLATRKYLEKGMLVPDDVTIHVCRYYIDGLIATNRYMPEQQFLLLDGLPRTAEQAKLLEEHISVRQIIVLDTDHENELIERMRRRAQIEGRMDDADPDVLQRRLEIYRSQTAAVLDYYPEEKIARFDCDQPPLCVLKDILGELSRTLTCRTRPLQSKV